MESFFSLGRFNRSFCVALVVVCIAACGGNPDGQGSSSSSGSSASSSGVGSSTGSSSSSNSSSSNSSSSSASSSGAHVIHDRIRGVYLNGMNVAWLDFARDFGNGFDEAQFRRMLQDVMDAGGNSIRWWVHTDGSQTPVWSGSKVSGPGGEMIKDLRRGLDIAKEYGVFVVPSLWSFDMLKDNDFRQPPNEKNYQLLTDESVLQSYIDQALVPMVTALKGHSQLFAWELFNEPEIMTENWFRDTSIEKAFYGGPVPTKADLVRVQAVMSAAIHKADADALVTTGSKSIGKYGSDVAGGTNWYRDDRMIAAAGGDAMATFDFYQAHYYNNEGKNGAWSPFHHDASYWQVNKPIVIGEFYIDDLNVLGENVKGDEMCQRLASTGYAGGWAWQWNQYSSKIQQCMRNVTL